MTQVSAVCSIYAVSTWEEVSDSTSSDGSCHGPNEQCFVPRPYVKLIFSNAAAFLLGTVAANHERNVHGTMGLVIAWLCASHESIL